MLMRLASMARAGGMLLMVCISAVCAFGQEKGRLTGVVRDSSGAPVAGITVVASNQVTGRRKRIRTAADGRYTRKLHAGAYRITLEATGFVFDKDSFNIAKDAGGVGVYVKPELSGVSNVIIEPGKETTLNLPLKEGQPAQAGGAASAPPPAGAQAAGAQAQPVDRQTVRDRWRIEFPEYDRYGDRGARGRDIPFKKSRWYDPYNQSRIKGDYPIIGNKTFMVLSAVDTSSVELRRTPTPSDVSSDEPGSAEFFGQPEQLAVNHTMQLTFELFHGDTTFKPRDWAIKISPTFSIPNYLNARENGVVNIDVRRGTNRTDTHVSLEEAFGEVKIKDVSENYDFISARVGIQPFVSDFRGFIFSDNNLGARIFGSFRNNHYQYNVAYFKMLEKDTNSGLNRFENRRQNVYVANLFRQDFLTKGYTIQASFHYNDDRGARHFDRNGFLVRPALIGDVRPHTIQVGYFGISGDGHLGRLNLTHSYYYAYGHDSHNPIAGRPVRVRSHMAAAEASVDKDYFRFRGSFFWASGDKDPTDGRATGFDAIFDDPNFIGGQFSFWNRQGIRLTQTGVGLVQPNSILPSLRSSKTEGQANFINPGIFIYNGGLDVEITQRLKAIFNVNFLRFHRTEALEYVLFQNHIRKDIGYDYSVGVAYRPFLINNITFTFGASVLQTGRGFKDIFTNRARDCPANVIDFCTPDNSVINPSKPLFSLFAQLKIVF